MSQMSDYFEKAILDHVTGNGALSVPTNLYLALSTATITDATTGSTITEPAGNGYAREICAFGAASSPGGSTSNTGEITFTASGGNWGSITDAAIIDAATLGNILWYGTLSTPRTVNDTDTLTFAASSITMTMA